MYAFTTLVDTLYNEIVALSVRVVRAYVYADEVQVHKEVSVPEAESVAVMGLPAPAHLLEIAPPIREEGIVAPLQVMETGVVLEEASVAASSRIPLVRGMIMYAGTLRVPVFKNPTLEFDTQVGTIPYGAMVIAGEPKGRFYHASWNDMSGWVLRDDLVERASEICPEFVVGEENDVDNPNTAQVRAIIGDEFGLGRSEFALQAGEYVLYRLKKRGVEVRWPDVRPRMPGAWHEILSGGKGVTVLGAPKAGSIMEYMLDGEMGHVAYVDAVFPDETIAISEVNNPHSGIYNERNITKNEWSELNPVFIEVI